jgi:hypothetical protein
MKGAGGAERAFSVGFLAAIATDKPGQKLESFHLCNFSCFCQFTYMHFMVFRVSTKIVNDRESVAHRVLLFFLRLWKTQEDIVIKYQAISG